MSAKNDGGPAFPVELERDGNGLQTGPHSGWSTGISTRDYFAIHADLSALEMTDVPEACKFFNIEPPAGNSDADRTDFGFRVIAAARYRYADAMLRAREA